MRYLYFGLLSIVAAGLIAGCSGAGRTGSLPQTLSAPAPITATPGPGVHGPLATTSVTLTMPVYATPPPRKQHKSHSQTAATGSSVHKNAGPPEGAIPSVVFYVNGSLVSTVNLTQGKNAAYFVTIPLPVGADHLVLELWDQHDGTGTKIATGVTDTTIVIGAVNTVNVSLLPIVAQVCLNTEASNVLYGTAGSSSGLVLAYDPDGTLFVPTVLPSSVTFTSTGSSGISFTPASIADPATQVTVSWSATSSGTATLDSSIPCTTNNNTITFGGPYAYVAGPGWISLYDQYLTSGHTNTGSDWVAAFNGPLTPGAIVFDRLTLPKKVFAADYGNNKIMVYNGETNTPLFPNIATAGRPWGLSLSSDGNTLYVGESGASDQVEMFDVSGSSITNVGTATGNALLDGSFINGLTTYATVNGDITAVGSRYASQNGFTTPSIATILNRTPGYQGVIPASAPPLAHPGFATAYSPSGPSANGSLLVRENGSPGFEWIDLGSSFLGASTGIALADQYVIGPNAIAVTGSNAYMVDGAESLRYFSWQYTNWQLSGTACVRGGCGDVTAQPVGVALSANALTLYVINNQSMSVFDLACGSGTPYFQYTVNPLATPFSIAIGDGGRTLPGSPNCG